MQDLEKHGRMLPCIMDLRQMLQTPIKPYIKPEEEEQQSSPGKKREEGEREIAAAKSEEKRQKESKGDGALSGDEDGETKMAVCVLGGMKVYQSYIHVARMHR